MPLMWFLAGVLTTLASLIALSPWLRKMSNGTFLAAQAVVVAAAIGVYFSLGHPTPAAAPASAFAAAARTFDGTGNPPAAAASVAAPASVAAAGSMESAIASLESRLAQGGGTADDWELLAKSFEFTGRPAAAAQARAHQLPGAQATAVSGEVTLAAALSARAVAGETLFIVAKSVDSPGVPVAVIRASVGRWPLKFTLDDSQSMMPGRNLSTAGRVTVEARISQKGQPLPGRGDLQGSTGIIDPANRQPLKIVIDREIS